MNPLSKFRKNSKDYLLPVDAIMELSKKIENAAKGVTTKNKYSKKDLNNATIATCLDCNKIKIDIYNIGKKIYQ